MALTDILTPPKRVQFIERSSDAFGESSILGGVLPLPDFLAPGTVILILDATPRQSHAITTRIPQHPVEVGADINDHIQPEPRRLVIDGVVSDTPIDLIAAIAEPVAALIRGASRSISAYEKLKELAENLNLDQDGNSQPFDVQTGLDLYESMGIESLTVTRTSETGKAIEFTAALKEIRIVSSEIVSATGATTESATGGTSGVPTGTGTDVNRGRQVAGTPSAGAQSQASGISAAIAP